MKKMELNETYSYGTQMVRRDVYHLLKTYFNNLKGKLLLDVGCGDGKIAMFLRDKGGIVVTGVDPDPNAKNKFKQNTGGKFYLLKAEEMPFKEEFDIVFYNTALHHTDDPQEALKRSFKALKQGGILLFVEPIYDNPFRKLEFLIRKAEEKWGDKPYTILDYKNWVEEAGFKILIFKTKYYPPTSLNRIYPRFSKIIDFIMNRWGHLICMAKK